VTDFIFLFFLDSILKFNTEIVW